MTRDLRRALPAISRRRLVQVGAGSAAGAALTAGLGRRPGASLAQDGATPLPGANPFGEATTQGGTYVLAYAGKGRPRMFVPTSYFGTDAFFVCKLLYTPLLRLDPDWQNLGPGVATEWEWSADQTQLTVGLRDDVVFHDGRPLTAADVVFTYKLMVRADRFPAVQDISIFQGGDDYQAGTTDEFAGVEAVDDQTVRFNLSSPSSVFLLNISWSEPRKLVHLGG